MCDASTSAQAGRRAAVEHLAAALAGVRADVDEPVGAAHHVEVVLDDEERVAGAPRAGRARAAAPRCRPDAGRRRARRARRRRRTGSSGSAWPGAGAAARRATASACCGRARGSRGRARCSVAMRATQVGGDALRGDALLLRQVGRAAHVGRACVRRAAGGDAARGVASALRGQRRPRRGRRRIAARGRREQLGQASSGSCDSAPMSRPAKVTDSASRLSRLPWHAGQSAADHEARHALLHQRALRGREGVQHVPARAGEGAHVARLRLAAQRARASRPGVKPA